MCRLSLPVFTFVIVCQIATAEIRLTGRVIDENNAPVAAAQVRLESGAIKLQSVADPTGAFSFEAPAAGGYLLSVEREGYFQLKNRPVQLNEGPNEITLILNLVREVFESIDVAASGPGIDFDKTSSEHGLTGTQILEAPYPTAHSLRNAMRLLPNVVQDSTGGIHIDGGAENQVLYTLDGFNITDPLTGRFNSRLSVEAVRSLEVSSGRFPAELGKGSAGTLAVKTNTGDDKLRYTATNFIPGVARHKGFILHDWVPRLNVSGPIRKGRAWFSDSIFAQYANHVVEDLPKGQDRTASWLLTNLLYNQINLSPSSILYTGFLLNYEYAPRNGLGALDPAPTTSDFRSRQWFFHVKDQVYFKRGALLEFGYAANRTFSREIPQGHGLYLLTPNGRAGNYFLDAARKARRDQLIANAFLPSFTWFGAHQLKVGIDLDGLNYWQDARRTGYENYRIDGTRLSRVLFGGRGQLSRANVEASSYVEDSWKLRPKLLVEAGLRQDWDEILGVTSFSPRAGFSWSPGRLEHTKISGGFAIIYDATNLRPFSRPRDQYTLTTYFLPDGEATGPSANIFTINHHGLARPRYQNWSISVEQQLPARVYARINYLRKRGRDGFTYENVLPYTGQPPAQEAARFGASHFDAIYQLSNARRDVYDSVEITVRQAFRGQYEWLASYTRSRALSNAVYDVSADDPLIITNNVGRMPWDSPNRFLGWGYAPLPRTNWALAFMLETRNGFPFSIVDDEGRQAGALNSMRFPTFFELNLDVERRLIFRANRWAWRAGFNNITNHQNPNVVNNNTASPHFLAFYGGQKRALVFRLRWLGKAEKLP